MHIHLSPQRNDGTLELARAGELLIVNGAEIDLSVVAEGETVPGASFGSDWLIDQVTRIDGVLHVTVILPHGAAPGPAVAFPEPMIVVEDGPISVPRDPVSDGPSDAA